MSRPPADHPAGSAPTLDHAAVGSTVTVADLRTRTSAVGQRLADLGFLPGTTLRVIRRAPLGDPTVFELRGYQICLRRAETSLVEIEPGEPALRGPA